MPEYDFDAIPFKKKDEANYLHDHVRHQHSNPCKFFDKKDVNFIDVATEKIKVAYCLQFYKEQRQALKEELEYLRWKEKHFAARMLEREKQPFIHEINLAEAEDKQYFIVLEKLHDRVEISAQKTTLTPDMSLVGK
jgi:DNA-binding LytR/AlgR family response regulator